MHDDSPALLRRAGLGVEEVEMRTILRGYEGEEEIYWASLPPGRDAHEIAAGMSREAGTRYEVDDGKSLARYVGGDKTEIGEA